MAQLRQDYKLYQEQNTEILAIGPDSKEAFDTFWETNQMPFLGMSDPKRSILSLFGQKVKIFRGGRMPAMVIVDPNGIVRFAHYGHQMSDIPENNEVLSLLSEINQGVPTA
jgi:peroxiredoxin Q/BCP